MGSGLIALAVLSACAVPGPSAQAPSAPAQRIATDGWHVVAVLPLTGHSALSSSAGEWLAYRLKSRAPFQVISPGVAETRLADVPVALLRSPMRFDEAAKYGRQLGAQAVITGRIDYAGVARTCYIVLWLVDASGHEQASVKRPVRSVPFRHDPYELALLAVEEAADEMADLLRNTAEEMR